MSRRGSSLMVKLLQSRDRVGATVTSERIVGGELNSSLARCPTSRRMLFALSELETVTKSITRCLASVSSPDVKMTVRGLFGEKSCIQAIGMLLIDFTSREQNQCKRNKVAGEQQQAPNHLDCEEEGGKV